MTDTINQDANTLVPRSMDTAPRNGESFWGLVGEDAISMFWHPTFSRFVSKFSRMMTGPGVKLNDGKPYHDHSPVVHDPHGWLPKPDFTNTAAAYMRPEQVKEPSPAAAEQPLPCAAAEPPLPSVDAVIARAIEDLTPRERQMAEFLQQGMSNKEVAVKMNIRVATVKAHVRHLMHKLGAHNRTQVAMIARQAGVGRASSG